MTKVAVYTGLGDEGRCAVYYGALMQKLEQVFGDDQEKYTYVLMLKELVQISKQKRLIQKNP